MEPWKFQSARDLDLSPNEKNRSLRRESGLASTVLRFCWWSAMRGSLRVFHRLEIIGAENLPKDPSFVLVANHASHLDALVLGSALPMRLRHLVFPLAAGDTFFETPLTAAFSANILNALPVWRKNRGSHDVKVLRRRLVEEPSIFILFPEGTRSRTGEMAAFQAGVGMMTAGTSVPVTPCYLHGAFHAFPPDRRLPRFTKLRLCIGKPLCFENEINRRKGWKEVTARLEEEVRRLGESETDA
ncbi:MAG: 1-acyl-sn-glycerol-3-phosphate acyltransferase [Planctomycetales bacterium]